MRFNKILGEILVFYAMHSIIMLLLLPFTKLWLYQIILAEDRYNPNMIDQTHGIILLDKK